jgi:glycosyltransferase involved in cell wall biosynthesis
MRFHVLGLAHTQTTREYSCCAFTQKIRLLCKMLHGLGHTVIHYGVEGSNPECTESVSVVPLETFRRVHNYDFRTTGFTVNLGDEGYRTFTSASIDAIRERLEPMDFLLCPFGVGHKPQADAVGAIAVEPGIGYEQTFANYRVFESYAWMHFHYGKEQRCLSPRWYDAVIPNYLDMADYPYQPQKKDYAILVGRQIPLKGVQVASDVCNKAGIPLYIAGQGDLGGSVKATHLGVLSIEERAKWVGEAKVLFAPTQYIEPFGAVIIEAMAYGTPVITTDFGAFSETVTHGVTGYRCRTFEQFVWAAKHVENLSPAACRAEVLRRWSLERVSEMYQEYFTTLHRLYADPAGWYAENPDRASLDWLR